MQEHSVQFFQGYHKVETHRIDILCMVRIIRPPNNEDLLKELLTKKTVKEVAADLLLAPGTVVRWLELASVPPHYHFDLLRLLGKKPKYWIYTAAQKDQFFTPDALVSHCWSILKEKIDIRSYTFVEPSAGDGAFLKVLPEGSIGLDIEPRSPTVKKQDFLEWTPPAGRYIVVGNPPFGLRGHLALHFLNHSATFADYACFILPQNFESDGKGAPRKRVVGYTLIHSEKVDGLFHTPEASKVQINGVFQIWSRVSTNDSYAIQPPATDRIKIYSLSDGGTVATTRNKKMLKACDLYLPSTCFGAEAMHAYPSFEELPGRKGYGVVFLKDKEVLVEKAKRIDWSSISFLSTNSALNLRTSLIYTALSGTS
jgi:hypothetical protein